MEDINKRRKQYAAFAYALGVARGALGDVIDGDFTNERVQRIFDATGTARIAASIGLQEGDLATDWNEYLSDAEKEQIQGYEA